METNKMYYKGYKIKIEQDEFINDSPDDFDDWDNFLVYDHRDFEIKRHGYNPEDIFNEFSKDKKLFGKYWIFPVFAYIHSRVSLSLCKEDFRITGYNYHFDVSFKGFAMIKRQKESYTEKQAYNQAKDLIEIWNDYLHGNVWNYTVYDKNENIIDSVCGFYGNPEKSGVIDEAKNSVDCEIRNRMKKKIEQVKIFIKNHVPLETRNKLIVSL